MTIMLAVPLIARIAPAMIWFGASNATVAAAILSAATLVVLGGAAEDMANRDRGLHAMAEVFGADPLCRF